MPCAPARGSPEAFLRRSRSGDGFLNVSRGRRFGGIACLVQQFVADLSYEGESLDHATGQRLFPALPGFSSFACLLSLANALVIDLLFNGSYRPLVIQPRRGVRNHATCVETAWHVGLGLKPLAQEPVVIPPLMQSALQLDCASHDLAKHEVVRRVLLKLLQTALRRAAPSDHDRASVFSLDEADEG